MNQPATFQIRSAEPSDAEAIAALLAMPGVAEGLLQIPDSPNATRIDYHRNFDARECRLVAVADGQVIGLVGFHASGPSLRRAHARSVGLCVAPAWQGKGVGRQLLVRALDWADNWAGVLRVELHVHADNERAQALYRSLGFVEEGRHRAYGLRAGEYVDSLSMARLHPKPPRLPA